MYACRYTHYYDFFGWGIFLIFGASEADDRAQIVAPYPPFGLATITVLNIASIFDVVRNLQFSGPCFSE